MRGAIPPLPQYVFMVWYLVKHRDNCTFYMRQRGVLKLENPLSFYLSVNQEIWEASLLFKSK
jgi:hypothetical protein